MRRRPIVDRVLGAVGLARKSTPAKRSVYAGARVTAQNQDWFASMLSADRSIKGDFRLLRERARQLGRDNPHVARYRGLQSDNVIGPDGIRLQCMIRKSDGTFDRDANRKIEAGWDEFCLPENASVDGLLSMTDIATLAVERWREDGEALIRMWPGFGNKFAFSLQMLDADVLDHTVDRAATDKQTEIRMGVERDRFGKPLKYWLWKRHPADYLTASAGNEREAIPAEEIIHIYTVRRPGQTRGITEYAPIMVQLNILGAYIEAELTAARVSASVCYTVEPTEGGDDGLDENDEEKVLAEMEPGMGLRVDGKVTMLDPKHPVSAFGTFLLDGLRNIAAGLHTAYSSLTGDLSQANYGSQRQGLLSERDGYKRAQRVVATKLYRRVYLRWLKFALTTGAVDLPMRDFARLSAFGAHRWLPRGFPWIDPMKDLQAAELELKNRLNTHTNIAAEDGRDWEEVLAQTEEEEALAAEYGVTLPNLSETKHEATDEDKPNDDKQPTGAGNEDDGSPDDGKGDRHSARDTRSGTQARRRFSLFGGRRKAG